MRLQRVTTMNGIYMRIRTRVRTLIPLSVAMAVVVSISGCPGKRIAESAGTAGDEQESPPVLVLKRDEGAGPIWDPEGLPDFEFTDRSGKTVTKQDLLGTPWVVGFVFTHCRGPCPIVTGQMKSLQNELKGTGVKLVTLTVDPKRDTPEVLKNYAEVWGADPERWYFLTGDQAEIYQLIGKSFLLPVEETQGPDRKVGFEVLHSNAIMHVNEKGVVVGKYLATNDEDMARLARVLKKGAGA